MKFKPFTKDFDFNGSTLTESFPDYLIIPITRWVAGVLSGNDLIYSRGISGPVQSIKEDFADNLQITLHRVFPRPWGNFISEVFSNNRLLCNFLALLLQNYCNARDATILEVILRKGGSAYSVERTDNNSSEYDRGVYDLVKRVPEVLKLQSRKSLSENQLLLEAWNDCYKHNPSYSDVVTKCDDFIEGFLRDKYWPTEKRTKSLVLCIKEFKKNPDILSFKGSDFINDKTHLISLLGGISNIRSQHTTGTGRTPKPDEAEYILHSTIYIWSLMRT